MQYTIISKKDCPWCDKARDLLYESGEGFVNVVYINQEPWAKRLLLMAGQSTVPQVFTPIGEYIGGYKQLEEYLAREQ